MLAQVLRQHGMDGDFIVVKNAWHYAPPRQTRLTQAYFFFTGVLFADKALMS